MVTNKISVLCTRAISDTLVLKASAQNIAIDVVPFIETDIIRSTDIAAQVKHLAQKKITAIFTSINAVEAVVSQLTHIPDWTICCLGGMTKDIIIDFFGESKIAITAKNASALADKIVVANPTNEAVFFCGDQRLDELPKILRMHYIEVKELIVYKTIQTPVYIEKNYNGIIFFSPSAVHSFFSVNTLPTTVVLFSIGKTTAATISTYCVNLVITSEWPGKEQMVDVVINYFK
jgi:uroporphyrinogen-III synthase